MGGNKKYSVNADSNKLEELKGNERPHALTAVKVDGKRYIMDLTTGLKESDFKLDKSNDIEPGNNM